MEQQVLKFSFWRHDIQHNDTQHYDIQHNDTHNNDIQHITALSINDLFVTLGINDI